MIGKEAECEGILILGNIYLTNEGRNMKKVKLANPVFTADELLEFVKSINRAFYASLDEEEIKLPDLKDQEQDSFYQDQSLQKLEKPVTMTQKIF